MRVSGDVPVPEMLLQLMRGVLRHHNGLIDEDADRDRQSRHGHDVGLDVDDVKHA